MTSVLYAILTRARGPRVEDLPDNRVDTTWLDRMTPFVDEPTFTPSDAQSRLAEVEQLLADHARSEGRVPQGSVRQQVEALLDRLHEQRQDI